jgi:fucose permease
VQRVSGINNIKPMYSRQKVFSAACIGMFFFGISLITLGSVLPALSLKFGLTEMQTSSVVTLLPAGVLAGSLVFGPVVDRFGYRLLLIASSILTAAGLALIGTGESISVVRLAVFVTGFGGGILNGETNTLVSDISGEDRNAKLSFLAIFFCIGALGIPLAMSALSGLYTFTTILPATSVLIGLLTIIFFFIRFPAPKQPQGFPVKEGFKLLRQPALLLLSLVLFFESGLEGLSNNWTTTYLEDLVGMNGKQALLGLSLLVLGMTFGRLFSGFILRKINSVLVLATGLFLILLANSLIILKFPNELISTAILGLGYAPVFPIVLGYIGTLYKDLSGTAFSIALFIALTGNTLLNFLMGLLADVIGIKTFPFLLIAALLCMVVIMAFALKRISKKIPG